MTTVALGVVAYRDAAALGALLRSARGFDEVVVVNMTSDPEVTAVCTAYRAKEIPHDENLGYAAGVNMLAKAATADRLLFSNDDIVLATDLVDSCRAAQSPVTVPRITVRGAPARSLKALPTVPGLLLEWVLLPDSGPDVGVVQKWRRPRVPAKAQAATAAAVLCDVPLLRQHPLPEEYFLYWEEMEWFWDLSRHGITVVYDPRLSVERSGGASELGEEKWRLMGANLVRLGARRRGRAGAIIYTLLAVLWLLRLVLTDAPRSDRAPRWRCRRAGLAGAFSQLRSSL